MSKAQQESKATKASAQSESISIVNDLLVQIDMPTDLPQRSALKKIISSISSAPDKGITPVVVDELVADIDEVLGKQVDAILHQEDYQRLESAWRGLKFVMDRTNPESNIQIELLNISKDDLARDFIDMGDPTRSGLYHLIHTPNIGSYGGEPISAIVANYEFGPQETDIRLLGSCASVAAMSHAPFIAAASPKFIGRRHEDFTDLPKMRELKAVLETNPAYSKWRTFRETDDAKYVGLTLPRFMLRSPHGQTAGATMEYQHHEDVSEGHEQYLWGNASFAMATRLTESFANYGFCANIVGPAGGGAVQDLSVHEFEAMGQIETKPAVEALLSHEMELKLADLGFIGLCMKQNTDKACFFSANSTQKPRSSPDMASQASFRLASRLPYLFVVSRFAHYINSLMIEDIGANITAAQLQKKLNEWLRQYHLDQDLAAATDFAERPLRKYSLTVSDVAGEPGWYKVELRITPHFKFEGADFELSLEGNLNAAAVATS